MKTIGLRLALYFGLTILLACVGIGVFAISYSSYILEEAAERTLPVYGNGTARLVENSSKLNGHLGHNSAAECDSRTQLAGAEVSFEQRS